MLRLMQVVLLSVLCTMVLGCRPIITRRQWGARLPNPGIPPLRTPVLGVIIHHTTGKPCTSQASCSQRIRGIQNYHMTQNHWPDIGYNFLVGEDGRVYEGRGWRKMGAHAPKWNAKSLGISFVGDFSKRPPRAAALNAARCLIRSAVTRGVLSHRYVLKGHRNVWSTACPGKTLYGVISKWPHFKA